MWPRCLVSHSEQGKRGSWTSPSWTGHSISTETPKFRCHLSSGGLQIFQNSGRNLKILGSRNDTKQVPHWGVTNVRRHCTKFSGPYDVKPWFCAPQHLITAMLTKLPGHLDKHGRIHLQSAFLYVPLHRPISQIYISEKKVTLSQVLLYYFCTLFGRTLVTNPAWMVQYNRVSHFIHQNYRCHQISSKLLQ